MWLKGSGSRPQIVGIQFKPKKTVKYLLIHIKIASFITILIGYTLLKNITIITCYLLHCIRIVFGTAIISFQNLEFEIFTMGVKKSKENIVLIYFVFISLICKYFFPVYTEKMVVRQYQEELQYLEKINDYSWRIKKGFQPNMNVREKQCFDNRTFHAFSYFSSPELFFQLI